MRILFIFLLIHSSISINGQQSLAEKLGFTDNDKLLIIHGDDLGVAHSQNIASFLAMKGGNVSSASIMMPCPWVSEVAEFSKANPTADLGLHLTLTNEWNNYNWGPVASKDKVSSITNELGFLYDDCLKFGQNAVVAEAEIELRAQIELAFKLGMKPSHFDTHMGCLIFSSPDLFEVYLKLGREYKIPVMLSRLFIQAASKEFKDKITKDDIIIEHIYTANIPDYEAGMDQYYESVLNEIQPGVHVLLIHLAFNDAEMQAVTVGQEPWGALWRQQDFDFFTSTKCKQLIEKNNIKLITWRSIQEAWYKD